MVAAPTSETRIPESPDVYSGGRHFAAQWTEPEGRPDEHFETPEVEFQGRRFPAQWTIPKDPPRIALRRVAAPSTQQTIQKELGHEILSRLPWQSLAAGESDTQQIVAAYVASLQMLLRFRADVDHLLNAACAANLEFRQASGETHAGARDETLKHKLSAMLQKAGLDWPPIRNELNAKLVSKAPEVLRHYLSQAIEKTAYDFSEQMFEALARLVDQELLGLVEWLPNNCCAYHFFKQVVLQENYGTPRIVSETRFDRITERDQATGRQIIGTRTTKVTKGKGRHVHRFARHEHDVMHAIQTSIANSKVVMPPQVVRLCEAIPGWLEPFVRVIDGTIFRERIIERDVEVTNWQDVAIHDEPVIGCEPAVVVGPFVLTGWGPREVRNEELRRAAEINAASTAAANKVATLRFPIVMAIAVALAAVSIALTLQTSADQVSLWVVAGTVGATIACAWYAASDYAQLRRLLPASQWATLTSISVACQFGIILWAIVRLQLPVTGVIPATLLVGAVAAHVLATRLSFSSRTLFK
jgi:hypothetical protein